MILACILSIYIFTVFFLVVEVTWSQGTLMTTYVPLFVLWIRTHASSRLNESAVNELKWMGHVMKLSCFRVLVQKRGFLT